MSQKIIKGTFYKAKCIFSVKVFENISKNDLLNLILASFLFDENQLRIQAKMLELTIEDICPQYFVGLSDLNEEGEISVDILLFYNKPVPFPNKLLDSLEGVNRLAGTIVHNNLSIEKLPSTHALSVLTSICGKYGLVKSNSNFLDQMQYSIRTNIDYELIFLNQSRIDDLYQICAKDKVVYIPSNLSSGLFKMRYIKKLKLKNFVIGTSKTPLQILVSNDNK